MKRILAPSWRELVSHCRLLGRMVRSAVATCEPLGGKRGVNCQGQHRQGWGPVPKSVKGKAGVGGRDHPPLSLPPVMFERTWKTCSVMGVRGLSSDSTLSWAAHFWGQKIGLLISNIQDKGRP